MAHVSNRQSSGICLVEGKMWTMAMGVAKYRHLGYNKLCKYISGNVFFMIVRRFQTIKSRLKS